MNRWFDKIPVIGNRIPGKIILSFLMLLFAILMQRIYRTSDRTICVLAMFFSFVGDVALNHKRNHNEQSLKDFVIGGTSFIFAHICYCIAYNDKIVKNNYLLINPGFVFSIFIIIAISYLTITSSKSENNPKLLAFGIAYLWITGINYITIFSYSYSVKSVESFAALGGLLFLSSDVIIGLEKFSGLKSSLARELVWWLYPIGQIILIAMA